MWIKMTDDEKTWPTFHKRIFISDGADVDISIAYLYHDKFGNNREVYFSTSRWFEWLSARYWMPLPEPPKQDSETAWIKITDDEKTWPEQWQRILISDGTNINWTRAIYDGKISADNIMCFLWGPNLCCEPPRYWMPLPEPPREGEFCHRIKCRGCGRIIQKKTIIENRISVCPHCKTAFDDYRSIGYTTWRKKLIDSLPENDNNQKRGDANNVSI